MFNPNTKFDVSTITCNEEMEMLPKWKAVQNVKILVLSHPLGDLGVPHRVHLRLDGKRIIDFPLAIIQLFSLALMPAALLSDICRSMRFLKGGSLERKFSVDGEVARSPSMNR